MTRRRSFYDLPPRLLSPEELDRIANARMVTRLGPSTLRGAISRLLAHIDALGQQAEPPVSATQHPRLRKGAGEMPQLRVRPELPRPGSAAWTEHVRRVKAAMAPDPGGAESAVAGPLVTSGSAT